MLHKLLTHIYYNTFLSLQLGSLTMLVVALYTHVASTMEIATAMRNVKETWFAETTIVAKDSSQSMY